MASPLQEHRSATHVAAALSIACLLAVAAIWLLNVSIYTATREYLRQSKQVDERERMLARLKVYREKGPKLYEQLIQSTFFMRHHDSEAATQIRKSTQEFGQRVYERFAEAPSLAEREVALEKLGDELFGKIIDKRTWQRATKEIASADSPDSWGNIAYWVTSNYWPKPDYMQYNKGGRVSYAKAENLTWDEVDDESLVESVLSAKGPADGEAFLIQDLVDLRVRLMNSTPKPKEIALPGIGVPIAVNHLLVLIAPCLAALTAVFFLFKHHSVLENSNASTFDFPQFQSPNDPLIGLYRLDLYDIIQRAVWSIFLLSPLLVVLIGVLFRYNIATPFGTYAPKIPLFSLGLRLREGDVLSTVVDYVNLFCAAFILIFIYYLTAPTDVASRLMPKRQLHRLFRLVLIVAPSLALCRIVWELLYVHVHEGRSIAYELSLGAVGIIAVALLICSLIGSARSRLFFAVTCAGVLLIIALACGNHFWSFSSGADFEY